MSYSQVPDTAATHERLMGELTQRLVSISDARDSGEPTPANPPQADYGAAGDPSSKPLPPSAVSVISCSGHQHDNMHVQITIKCPCSRSRTAEASTQTDELAAEIQQPICNCQYARRVPQSLKEICENVCQPSSIHQAMSAVGAASSTCVATATSLAAMPSGVPPTKDKLDTKYCVREKSHTPLFSAGDISPRRISSERRRSVHEALARVREVLFEVLRETPRAVATTTSTAGIFATMFPEQPSPTKMPQDSPPSQVQATPDAPAKGQDTLDTAEDQTILDLFEDSLNPRTDARRYTVSDELCAIYERIESRWAEVCKTIRADLNRRYNQFVEGCRECLKQQPGEPSRDELRQDMSNVRRELIAEMKEVFRSSCEEFDKWRVWYLERELQQSFSEMQDGDRLSVTAAVLRYEILEGLPELEKCTRERAAALWKELVEEQWIDVDALFDS
ncbi:uncharacterized protein LOC142814057 [Rhipicephalus microplus]|uniref:uncharacterized protein LOC142814057 n=1 Tax=Rhipicephalus microplus TaxID=6941 RepID=UPI003F6AD69A